MKKNEIKVGRTYRAKVGTNVTTVRVDAIREVTKRQYGYGGAKEVDSVMYDVTNLATGRKTSFRSAMKFRSEVVRAQDAAVQSVASTPVPDAPTPVVEDADETCDACGDEVRVGDGTRTCGCGTEVVRLAAKPAEPAAQPAPVRTAPSIGLARNLAAQKTHPHVIVEARAGTGKTFTLVVGIVYAFRDRAPGLWERLVATLGFEPVPSPQQRAVWDSMRLSADASTVQMTAFNRSIVREFETKWGWVISELAKHGVTLQFATNHSMGFAAVRKAFNRRLEVSEYRVMDIIADLMNQDVRELRKKKFELLRAVENLVGLCKMNLVDGTDRDQLDQLIGHYDVDVNGYRAEVYDLVPRVIERCKDPMRDGRINYDDMIWLPVVLGLDVARHDLLLVDECQDLNRCQQALAKKAGRRLILVGDPKQAIYGFAGADSQSMPRMQAELGATAQGCEVLPLTVTRRCGHAIVAEANRLVPDFQAHEGNHAGSVAEALYPTYERDGQTHERPWAEHYMSGVKPGDMVLCRVNAPLVANCFRFLKAGVKANIQGRDVGQGLISTIKKLNAESVPDLVGKITDWLHTETAKEQAKRMPSEARIIALQDRADCLVCFTEGQASVADVVRRIETIFTDDRQGGGVKLSSIHKAKGLEAKRVFILQPKGATIPHPMARSAWQREQEYNLLYVAVTRAIEELVYVG